MNVNHPILPIDSSHLLQNLSAGSHIHLLGICGTAMASLAGLLVEQGFRVTGSDSQPYPPMSTQVESLGIKVLTPYQASNLQPVPDFAIVGNVISASNPEVQELLRLKVPLTSLPRGLGEILLSKSETLVVAGTHGKTTTTSLLAWVASELGFEPGFLIGGIPKNFSKSFRNPRAEQNKPRYFVIEGDEYDTAYFDKVPKFIHYHPKHAILTSIEFDHADIYRDLAHVQSAFRELLVRIPVGGHLLVAEGIEGFSVLGSECRGRVHTYGIGRGDYQVHDLVSVTGGCRFSVVHSQSTSQSTNLGEFFLPLTGEYNVLNATAVIGLAAELGWDLVGVKSAMKSFLGVKRRQEVLAEIGGVRVVEDFAHHPTAVRETLKGLKLGDPSRRILAVFEPRSATSRRKIFQKDYVSAFQNADEILVMEAFDTSKVKEEERFSSAELAADLVRAGREASAFSSVEAIVERLAHASRSGDSVVIMSNGGFGGIYEKLLAALRQKGS